MPDLPIFPFLSLSDFRAFLLRAWRCWPALRWATALFLAGLCPPGVAATEDVYAAALAAIAEGRPEEARALLARLAATEPEHAGAWLDLAILQCALGHRVEAEALFEAIELRFAPGPALRELIAQQRAGGCRRQSQPGALRVRLGRGYDSNANQGASNPNLTVGDGPGGITLVLAPEHAPRGDGFTQLQMDAVQPLSEGGLLGFGQVSVRHHDVLHAFDVSSLAAGLEQPWRLGGWELRAALAAGWLGLNGRLYQQSVLAQAQATPPLPLPRPWRFSVVAGQSFFDYVDQPVFDARQHELRGVLTHAGERVSFHLAAGGLRDQGRTDRPGGNRSGWSFSLWGRVLWGSTAGEFLWSRQHWDSSRDFSPGFIDHKRRQDVRQWRLALTQPLGNGHALVAELRQVTNAENISIFGYRSRQFSLSWQLDQ